MALARFQSMSLRAKLLRLALRLFKQAIDDGLDQPLETALRLERLVTAEHLLSGDVQEGLRAFGEKREPVFPSATSPSTSPAGSNR